jgi:uncharacterized protein (DUF488 family)
MQKLYTIGFTKKSAEEFFKLLLANGVKKIIDVRLWNNSVHAGFTNIRDFPYLLGLHNIDYSHLKVFAPSKEILSDYKNNKIDWAEYKVRYLALLDSRNIIKRLQKANFDNACLLCAEPEADNCHRLLLANYLKEHFSDIEIINL